MTEEKKAKAKKHKQKKKQEVEDKSCEEEDDELSKAGFLLVTDGSSWLERRKGEGGGRISHGGFQDKQFRPSSILFRRNNARPQRWNSRVICSTKPSEEGEEGEQVDPQEGKNMDLAADAC